MGQKKKQTKICLLAYSKSKNKWLKLGRINIDIPDELERQLRIKTVEQFGGKKGDLSKAIQEAVKTWIDKKQWSPSLFKS